MRLLRSMWKWWRQLWVWAETPACCIDSHKWETKIEILGRLSNKRY